MLTYLETSDISNKVSNKFRKQNIIKFCIFWKFKMCYWQYDSLY